jgi:hypothetical protein
MSDARRAGRVHRLVRRLREPVPIPRAIYLLLIVCFTFAMTHALNAWHDWRSEDPTSVSIGAEEDSREIDPRQAIATQCSEVIEAVGHIDEPNPVVTYHGVDYERWRVEPKLGHMDRVLLNFETGEVICP